MAPRRKGDEFCQRLCSLTGKDAVAESGELLSMAQPHTRIGDPPWSSPMSHSTNAGAPRGPASWFRMAGAGADRPAGDSFPSGDSFGVASPASKNSSISANSVSHPEVHLRVHHDAVPSLIHDVVSGDLDIAVADRPFERAHLHKRPMVAQSLVLAVNHRDPLARRRRVRLSDLADRQFAEYRSDSALRARIDVACEEAGLHRRSIFEADTIADLLSAVEHGIGIALVPPETMVGHPHLRTVNTEPEIGRELVMVYAANRPPSPATDRFLSTIEYSLTSDGGRRSES